MKIHQLFPEPVYFSKLERALTEKELKTVNEYKKKTKKNAGNSRTSDNYVLEHKTLENLKKDLNKMIIDYFNKIVCTDDSIIPYITQSWINYTETNQFHHRHFHPNSYISGVFYIAAEKGVDQIRFDKPGYQQLELSITQHNIYNSRYGVCPVQTGDVILFPSSLIHGVPPNKGTDTRISLSFNVFFKGKIGNNGRLTELILE